MAAWMVSAMALTDRDFTGRSHAGRGRQQLDIGRAQTFQPARLDSNQPHAGRRCGAPAAIRRRTLDALACPTSIRRVRSWPGFCEQFDRMREGATVTFIRGQGPKGPRAENIRLVPQ
jgi:hypothetical protein